MAHKNYNLLLIVALFFVQSVQSVILLHFCTFQGKVGWCDANNLIDQTNRSLHFNYPGSVHINVTCTSTQAIRWVIDVPPKSGVTPVTIQGSEPIIRLQQLNNSSATAFAYSLSTHARLFELKGKIQCEAYANSTEYAQVFITTRTYLRLGKPHTMNFFVTKSDGPVVIPCSGTVPENEKLKLLKTSAENKVLSAVSDECLKCICYPFNQCRTPKPCGAISLTCGYFHISESYWVSAGRQLPPDLPPRYEVLRGWQLCVMNYDCAAATVRKHMWDQGTDCNGDGVVTCEDYILIHRYGLSRCRDYLGVDGGSMLIEHRPCLWNITVEEDITAQATYDQNLGFTLNGTADFKAIYICSSSLLDNQYPYTPLDSRNQVPSQIYFNSSGDAAKETTVSCAIEAQQFESIKLVVTSCQSLTQCDLKFRPYDDLGTLTGEVTTVAVSGLTDDGIVTARLPFPAGIIGCVGLHSSKDGIFKYVRHFDYFFTGLDARAYLLSPNIPNKAVIKFTLELNNATEGSTLPRTLTCSASSFLAFPVFRFAFHFSDGRIEFLPLESALTTGPLQTNYGQLSSVRKLSSEVERSLELTPALNVTYVMCMVRLVNSDEWINETLALPIVDSVITAGPYNNWAMWATIIGVLLVAAAYVIIRFKLKSRVLTNQEVWDFFHGDQASTANSDDSTNELTVEKVGFPKRFRLPPESYIIDWNIELGSGEYGHCHKGFLRQNGQNIPVAIKTLKNSADKEYFKSFLKEIKVMAYVGEHENVVKFYGAMVERISEQKCHAVMELSPFGNLQSFILLHFVSTDSRAAGVSPRSGYSTLGLTQYHLIHFCEQIAAAMEHIASKQVVHGDLATRNVLVFPNFVAKVTDFGLARRMYESGIYSRMKSNIPLPWRWLAPESLKSLEFSTASDVWSFGLTCWEILTQGDIPFAELQSSQELFEFVSRGGHLPRPACATTEIYDFLLQCWSLPKSERPSFSEAKAFFGALLESTKCDYSRIMPAELLDESTL